MWLKKLINKYNINPKNNVPQKVYGVYNPNAYVKQHQSVPKIEVIFDAVVDEIYYTIKCCDGVFTAIYLELPKKEAPIENIITREYDMSDDVFANFVKSFLNISAKWDSVTQQKDDRPTSWYAKFNFDDTHVHYASSIVPENFDEFKSMLQFFFPTKDGRKYSMDPNENVPYEVYGVKFDD